MVNGLKDKTPKKQLTSAKSKKWFRDNIRTLSNINIKKDLLSDRSIIVSKLQIGSMFMYLYDAKTKDKLPYYDMFPLTIVLDYDEVGFIGLNLHYLPIKLRELLLRNLLDLVNNNKYDRTTRIMATYKLLKSSSKFRHMKPCVKRYYFANIKSRILKVPPEDWTYSIYLPVERFNIINEHVWSDSKKRI